MGVPPAVSVNQVVTLSQAWYWANNSDHSAAVSGNVCADIDAYEVPPSIDQAQMGGVR
jgi:hypothetical protein